MCILCTSRPIYRSKSRSTYLPMYWSTCRASVDWYVGWHISECRSICRPRCVGWRINRCINRDISRVMVNISADISVDIAADTLPIRWSLIVGRISVDCWWYIGQKLRLLVYKLYAIHLFLVKNLWRLYVGPSCTANSFVVKRDTQWNTAKYTKYSWQER